jgi:hypothetical protein
LGDEVRFPENRLSQPQLDAIVSVSQAGETNAVFVNTSRKPVSFVPAEWDASLAACTRFFRLDLTTEGRIAAETCGERITLNGYGVGAISTGGAQTVIE